MLKKIFLLFFCFFSFFAYANQNLKQYDGRYDYNSHQLLYCFNPQTIQKDSPANLSSFGAYEFDIQYLRINLNNNCLTQFNDDTLNSIIDSGDIRNSFSNLGEYNVYGNYTVRGIPTKKSNIIYKNNSSHIIKNKKSGNFSRLERFEMRENDPRKKERNFSLFIKMNLEDNKISEPSKSKIFELNGKIKEGRRNYFIFTDENYIVFVKVYPIKYPVPKR